MFRPLKENDFHEQFTFGGPIKAVFVGNSRYLETGKEYNVTLSNRKNKVTVKLSYNPDLHTSNGGVEFSMGSFQINEPEENNNTGVHLDDLTPEDKERLLQEARELVDKENFEKNSKVMYSLKKKELVDETISKISNHFKIKNKSDFRKLHDRFINITNYLYSVNEVNPKIITNNDWSVFENICQKVYECMINSIK